MSLVIVFLVVVLVQLLFFALFIAGFRRKHHHATGSFKPVSLLICAHNEKRNLTELIPLLLNQTHPDLEIVIVDDRSTDGTPELLAKMKEHDMPLNVVRIDRTAHGWNPKKYALSQGIAAARHDIILLTDADCRPNSARWVSMMASKIENKKQIVLGFSPYYKLASFLNRFIRYETILTAMQYIGFARWGMPYMGVGRNMAYHRSLFENNEGFGRHIHVMGGDDDLFINRVANKHNVEVCMGEDSVVFSIPKTTWRTFLHQKLRHLSVGKYYRPRDKTILTLFSITYSLSWVIGIVLISIQPTEYWIPGVLLLRSLVVMIAVQIATNRLGVKFETWPVIFLDFVYAFYYISTALRALVTKRVQWTS